LWRLAKAQSIKKLVKFNAKVTFEEADDEPVDRDEGID
jgi:hypothetical protein